MVKMRLVAVVVVLVAALAGAFEAPASAWDVPPPSPFEYCGSYYHECVSHCNPNVSDGCYGDCYCSYHICWGSYCP